MTLSLTAIHIKLSVANKPFMLSVIMLSVVMLNVVAPYQGCAFTTIHFLCDS
jgi:hypothetical protein